MNRTGELTKPFTPPQAASDLAAVEAELSATATKIAAAEAEAARYSGGLIQAMTLSTVATMKQSQAMLDQKRLALKFGLPQFIGFANTPSAAASTSLPAAVTAPAPVPPPAPQTKDWEIVSIDSRVTEQNDIWWKYAWKLTLTNTGSAAHAFRATIEFQDGDGFIIDSDDSETFIVQGNSTDTATGFALIRVPGAGWRCRAAMSCLLSKNWRCIRSQSGQPNMTMNRV